MKHPEPVQALELFPEVREGLLALLAELSAADWGKPTACSLWSVKDIALHLLGGDIGILSRRRDAFTLAGKPIENWKELVTFINELNDLWVKATRRMSPRVLCDLLRFTGPQVEAYFASQDPFATGVPVNWAGSEPAPVWLDLAREYTERWHHQQQIREAVGKPGLAGRKLLAPVLQTFVRALPHNYRDVVASDATAMHVSISGEAGGDWFLVREDGAWNLYVDAALPAAARVVIAQDDAWRLFTKGLSKEEALRRVRIEGDAALGRRILDVVAVIA